MTLSLDYAATVSMRCAFDACTNDARYITIDGRFACATCPVQHKVDAVKITAVPELLTLARDFAACVASPFAPNAEDWAKKFRLVIGVVPGETA